MHVPLASTFILSSKAGKEVIVKPVVDRAEMTWRFEVDDKPSADALKAAKKGTKAGRGANFTCLLTGAVIDDTHIKAEAVAGRMRARLMAVVAENNRNRIYVSPTSPHEESANLNPPEAPEIDHAFPADARAFTPFLYGLDTWKKLFTPRQLTAMITFSNIATSAREKVLLDAKTHWEGEHANDNRSLSSGGLGPVAYADAIVTYLALVLDRMAYRGSSLCRWLTKDNAMGETMPKQALSMSWDFAEGNPFGTSSADILTCTRAVADCLDKAFTKLPAFIELCDARGINFAPDSVLSSDPPYYDNVNYSDLSDFFYVWLRRMLSNVQPDLFRRVLTPKSEELVAASFRRGGKDEAERHFMEGMKEALMRFVGCMEWSTGGHLLRLQTTRGCKECAHFAGVVQFSPGRCGRWIGNRRYVAGEERK